MNFLGHFFFSGVASLDGVFCLQSRLPLERSSPISVRMISCSIGKLAYQAVEKGKECSSLDLPSFWHSKV